MAALEDGQGAGNRPGLVVGQARFSHGRAMAPVRGEILRLGAAARIGKTAHGTTARLKGLKGVSSPRPHAGAWGPSLPRFLTRGAAASVQKAFGPDVRPARLPETLKHRKSLASDAAWQFVRVPSCTRFSNCLLAFQPPTFWPNSVRCGIPSSGDNRPGGQGKIGERSSLTGQGPVVTVTGLTGPWPARLAGADFFD